MMLYQQLNTTDFILGNKTIRFSESPALPLEIAGEAWFEGWEIPMVFAIDANKQCWKDNAHGGCLEKCVSREHLIVSLRDIEQRNLVRQVVGMKPEPMPWVLEALKANWSPASNWKRDDYDWEDIGKILFEQCEELRRIRGEDDEDS